MVALTPRNNVTTLRPTGFKVELPPACGRPRYSEPGNIVNVLKVTWCLFNQLVGKVLGSLCVKIRYAQRKFARSDHELPAGRDGCAQDRIQQYRPKHEIALGVIGDIDAVAGSCRGGYHFGMTMKYVAGLVRFLFRISTCCVGAPACSSPVLSVLTTMDFRPFATPVKRPDNRLHGIALRLDLTLECWDATISFRTHLNEFCVDPHTDEGGVLAPPTSGHLAPKIVCILPEIPAPFLKTKSERRPICSRPTPRIFLSSRRIPPSMSEPSSVQSRSNWLA